MFKRLSSVVVLSAAALSAAAMAAAGPLQVESKVLAEQRVRAADGSTKVVMGPVRRVVPGDRVVFALVYRNTGKQPISNVVLNNPVPDQVAYRGPSDNQPAPDVSVDGQTFGPLATLRVRDGASLRAATAADVTHVRWRIAAPIAPGAQGQVSFQAVLK